MTLTMNKIKNYSLLLLLSTALLSCKGNSTPAGNEGSTDSMATLNQPDTSKSRVDQGSKASVIVDTNWSQAVKTISTEPAKEKGAVQQPNKTQSPPVDDKSGKPKPKLVPFVDPFRPQELKDGLKKAQDGDLKGAIVDFTAALKKNPKNYNAYFYRAKARIETGDAAGAMEDINNAIENKGDEAIYFYYRAKMYSDAGESTKAIIDFTRAIQWKHDFTDAWNYLGVEKAKLGLHKEAVNYYDSAIIYNPNYALCYYNKGTSQAALKDYTHAIESFSNSISLSPKHTMSYLNRGNCYVENKDFKSAMADFSKAIEIEPKNSDAYFNRGAAHYLSGDNLMCPDWRKAASLGNTKAKSMLEKYCK